MIVRCDDCRFWAPHPNGEEGECRRQAPRLIEAMLPPNLYIDDGARWAVWPVTFHEWGCGDGVPKPQPIVPC